MRPSSRDYNALFLPPLEQKSGKLAGMKHLVMPGGADWTLPEASSGARSGRFREWIAQSVVDLERGTSNWDIRHSSKKLKPKFQSALSSRNSVAASSRRNSKSGFRLRLSDDCETQSTRSSATSVPADRDARLQQELAQLRTGEDAVKFFARHGSNSKTKVVYCNRVPDEDNGGSAHLNLVIVPEHLLKPEHFTISANGVFHVCPGEMSECTPLSEWIQHGLMHSVLSSMPFFRLYTTRKNFQFWHTSTRYGIFSRRRQQLSHKCFLAKPLFAQPLVNVCKLMAM
jgi:hypothetical protein